MKNTTELTAAQLRAAAYRRDADAARAAADAAELRARAEELAAIENAERPEAPAGLVDARALAIALRVSRAQITRLRGDGLPHEIVGTRARFDVAKCRAWLTARGPKAAPKTPIRPVPDDSGVDVSDVPGLRLAGGSR